LSRVIRYASLEDAEILGKIHSESLKAAFKNIIPDDVLNEDFSIERRTTRFIRELSEGSPRTAVVFEGNEPAGLISFGKCRYGDKDASSVEIWREYIIPKFWGSGVAKELMEWGINEILKEGFTNIQLWVLDENTRARRFYEKMGFNYDNTVQMINMGKELRELRYIKA